MRTAFFHEDDFGMVQLLPAAAREPCRAEMEEIEAKVTTAGSEFGFSELHMRSEPVPDFRSLGLTEAALAAVLEPVLPRFDEVYTGYSTHRERCPGLRAWGFDDQQALFAQVGADGRVGEVWLGLSELAPREAHRWALVLQSLPGAGELILADWYRHRIIPLADGEQLTAYLRGETPRSDGVME